MTKRPGTWAALLLLISLPACVFLQSTLLSGTLPGEVTLPLTFLLVCAAGLRWGAAGGTVAGLWGGALLGAAAGAMAAPLSVLYGAAGWLAGAHGERASERWTWPLAVTSLYALLLSGESTLSMWMNHSQPSLAWKAASLGWVALFSLLFLGRPASRREC